MKKRGNIKTISKPSDSDLQEKFSNTCWHFQEQPDKIGIGQNLIPAKNIGLSHQYGRIFSHEREIRWEGEQFWLIYEDDKGDFETQTTEIILNADDKNKEYQKINAVHYLKNGMVVYTRFKEIVR